MKIKRSYKKDAHMRSILKRTRPTVSEAPEESEESKRPDPVTTMLQDVVYLDLFEFAGVEYFVTMNPVPSGESHVRIMFALDPTDTVQHMLDLPAWFPLDVWKPFPLPSDAIGG